ncbi:MAG TPA: YCF48-related protein [Candidatus Kapabacteria bacterium]|nr:YCF48-related protein [Candidatus Kapabacteria bacterium]
MKKSIHIRFLCLFAVIVIGANSGFAQWKVISANTMQANLSSVCTANDSIGFMIGAVNAEPASTVILKTTDRGNTWSSSTWQGSWLYAVTFQGVDTGYIAGYNENCNCGDLLKTFNGGSSWVDKQFDTVQEGFNTLAFVDGTTGYASSVHGGIFKTTDAGTTWSGTTTNNEVLTFRNLSFPDRKTGYAVGTDPNANQFTQYPSYIYKTTDSGSTWQLLQDYSQQNMIIAGIEFLTPQTGFFAGYNGQYLIMRTTNGGTTWAPVYNQGGVGAVQGIYFKGNNGYAVGDNGMILVSSDTGRTWESKSYNTTNSLLDAAIFDTSHVVLVGQNGMALQSAPPLVVDEAPTSHSLVSLYPDPVRSGMSIFMNIPAGAGYSIQLYNVLGEEVKSIDGVNSSVSISAENLPAGTYIYHLLDKEKVVTIGKFIVN